jgi:predicted dienelactone hydrolase
LRLPLLPCLLLALAAACAAPEPLELPDDPAATGVPVGVMTVTYDDQVMEIWYPATDAAADEASESIDWNQAVPPAVIEQVDGFAMPLLPGPAVRDAAPRRLEEPVPVLLFSHGTAGLRSQSFDLTAHLASRGYVVVAPDHPGRNFADLAPCLFDPPLDGCLIPDGDDPAPLDFVYVQDWLESGLEDVGLDAIVDLELRGIFGHSAGAGSSATVGGYDARIDAVLGLAGLTDGFDVDIPLATLAGTCDGMVDPEEVSAGSLAAPDGVHVDIAAAGHLAFSDLCDAEFGALADEVLAPRPDISELFLDMLVALGIDGCDGYTPAQELDCGDAYMPLEESAPLVRHYSTVFFDDALKGEGAGIVAGVHDSVEVRP